MFYTLANYYFLCAAHGDDSAATEKPRFATEKAYQATGRKDSATETADFYTGTDDTDIQKAIC